MGSARLRSVPGRLLRPARATAVPQQAYQGGGKEERGSQAQEGASSMPMFLLDFGVWRWDAQFRIASVREQRASFSHGPIVRWWGGPKASRLAGLLLLLESLLIVLRENHRATTNAMDAAGCISFLGVAGPYLWAKSVCVPRSQITCAVGLSGMADCLFGQVDLFCNRHRSNGSVRHVHPRFRWPSRPEVNSGRSRAL